jgi:hypothetical protein
MDKEIEKLDLEVKLQVAARALVKTFYDQGSFASVLKVITRPNDSAASLRQHFLVGFGAASNWDMEDLGYSVTYDFLNAVKQVKEEDIK